MLVCPVSGVGKKELGDGQNKKFSSASRQNKKKEGKEWAGPPSLDFDEDESLRHFTIFLVRCGMSGIKMHHGPVTGSFIKHLTL